MSASLILSACNPTITETVTETEFIEREIPIQPRPRGVNLDDVEWVVINADNVDDFVQRFEENPDTVLFATTAQGYENLSVNLAQLRRYIEQQQQLLVYYESSVSGN